MGAVLPRQLTSWAAPVGIRENVSDSLPAYAQRLDALHRALADDFACIVGQLPLAGDEQLLDAGCGDGFFAHLLARRLPTGCVHGLDALAAYLEAAGERLRGPIDAGRVRLVAGDVRELPFDAGSLDVVWSAHGMQSYDDIPVVLAEFHRVLKPGGLLAVLETDAMHSIMLPWPPRLELAIRQAERRTLSDDEDRVGAYFPRYASRLFREAGFLGFAKQHTMVYRHAPQDEDLVAYIRLYVEDLLARTRSFLPATITPLAEELADSHGRSTPLPDAYFGSLQVLMTASR